MQLTCRNGCHWFTIKWISLCTCLVSSDILSDGKSETCCYDSLNFNVEHLGQLRDHEYLVMKCEMAPRLLCLSKETENLWIFATRALSKWSNEKSTPLVNNDKCLQKYRWIQRVTDCEMLAFRFSYFLCCTNIACKLRLIWAKRPHNGNKQNQQMQGNGRRKPTAQTHGRHTSWVNSFCTIDSSNPMTDGV